MPILERTITALDMELATVTSMVESRTAELRNLTISHACRLEKMRELETELNGARQELRVSDFKQAEEVRWSVSRSVG